MRLPSTTSALPSTALVACERRLSRFSRMPRACSAVSRSLMRPWLSDAYLGRLLASPVASRACSTTRSPTEDSGPEQEPEQQRTAQGAGLHGQIERERAHAGTGPEGRQPSDEHAGQRAQAAAGRAPAHPWVASSLNSLCRSPVARHSTTSARAM